MGESIEVIILAALAIFVAVRLYRVLGRRTGHERPRDSYGAKPAEELRRDKAISLPDRSRPTRPDDADREPAGGRPAEADQAGINRLRAADPGFDPDRFVVGARAAFEMIIVAFAAGDTGTLRKLLDDQTFENFSRAIKARIEAKQTLQATLVGINSAEVIDADLDGRMALVTVKIVSDQIRVTRDAGGAVVDGDPTRVETATDIWTFSRNTRSRDPNWMLVATRSPN